MRIPRIYCTEIVSENTVVQLDTSTSHYLSEVLRMQAGRKLIIFNGRGGEYSASIEDVQKKRVSVRIENFHNINPESPLKLKLGFCLIKNNPMDWLLQKATELGVCDFVPLVSEFTDINLPEKRLDKKLQHWQQIIQTACQQSGRTRLPSISKPLQFREWLTVEADQKYILHPYQSQKIDSRERAIQVALLVGPEGGFSEPELELAAKNQFIPLSLGPRILRAETAPLCAISILQHQLGDI